MFGTKSFRGILLLMVSSCIPAKGRDNLQVRRFTKNSNYIFVLLTAASLTVNLPAPFLAGSSVITTDDFINMPSGWKNRS